MTRATYDALGNYVIQFITMVCKWLILIAWSIFQSLERNNSEFIDSIQNKSIKRVYEE